MSERDVLHRAAYMLAIVKDHVPSCSGESLFLSLRNDGTMRKIFYDPVVKDLEDRIKSYHLITQQLLWSMADVVGVKDSDFEKNLQLFESRVLKIRRNWSESRRKREAEFRALNLGYDGPDPMEI
jgi:hypothetical protein